MTDTPDHLRAIADDLDARLGAPSSTTAGLRLRAAYGDRPAESGDADRQAAREAAEAVDRAQRAAFHR